MFELNNKTNFKFKKMTKLFSIIAVAIIATSVVSCGHSAEDKAKLEEQAKHAADSIAAATELAGAINQATDTTAAPAAAETATPAAEAHGHDAHGH